MSDAPDERLIPVPIPPLVDLLRAHEAKKGVPLTREEVESVRGNAICMMMRISAAEAMAARRGYRDIDPKNVWDEWLKVRGGT